MKIKEAIILAGGLGTRLRGVVSDVPKCLVPIGSKTFLDIVISHVLSCGINRIIFSIGYKGEMIESHLCQNYPKLNYICVTEKEPLGTGGAIKLAARDIVSDHFFVLNGDTLFTVDLAQLITPHLKYKALCTLALKPMINFDRYGSVEIDENSRITSFNEKTFCSKGIINGGIYLIDKSRFNSYSFRDKFSFEKEVLETYVSQDIISGFVSENYFIDIGIPEDYKKAIKDLS